MARLLKQVTNRLTVGIFVTLWRDNDLKQVQNVILATALQVDGVRLKIIWSGL